MVRRLLHDPEGFRTDEAIRLEEQLEKKVTEVIEVCSAQGYGFRDVVGALHRAVAERSYSEKTREHRREAQEGRLRRNEARRIARNGGTSR